MKRSSLRIVPLALMFVFSPGILPAASIHSGPLGTSFVADPLPGPAVVNQSSTITIDLSNPAGLTPGQSIRIDFTPDDSWFWVGSFHYGEGTGVVTWSVTTSIMTGAGSAAATDTWSLGEVEFQSGYSTIAGYTFGPLPPAGFSLVVPWGTDLSAVELTVTDQSSIVAPFGGFPDSAMSSPGGIFTTTSVPEPSCLWVLGLSLTLGRRRRLGPAS